MSFHCQEQRPAAWFPSSGSPPGRPWARACMIAFAAALGSPAEITLHAADGANEPALRRYEYRRVEMAVDFLVTLYAEQENAAQQAAEAAFERIRELNDVFSDYDADSELRKLCETAGRGESAAVSADLWNVLEKAQHIAELSDGAFDITCGNVVRLWRRARRQRELPPPNLLKEAMRTTGRELLRLDPQQRTAELLREGMRLDLGGIAKGYATAAALEVLRRRGIRMAMIDAGGDLCLGDAPPGTAGWTVGVAPRGPNGPPRWILSTQRQAVATSGDMWQFVVIDGKRYSHIVDPRTGLGLTNRLHCTIVHPDGPTADALATAVSVLGIERGLKLIESVPNAAGLLVPVEEPDDRIVASSRWSKLAVSPRRTDRAP